ncbi:LysR substrate-binding domain-containing protein [Pseudomonas sp. GXZC]|uniref:LysR substrate-binding domain-containing protein n=1 Tax=Pseudomonas sp. GXZC TaxID=3003351 RepID=UPI0022AABA79|nr:LysR substrate-binding domain-containing protein [Pseudomonas sp. GXZC]WAT26374.1 LysR substrate-binding domain-containing protein [Pseudomonas sp. GXZC]
MRVNLDVQSLRSFIKVGETKSFTRAAQALSLTQPAISQQIRRLEDLLSVELFVRERGRVLLTLEGEKLIGYAMDIVACNDKIGGLFEKEKRRETVVLGMPEHFCERVLPHIISNMSIQFPSTQIVVKVARSGALLEAVKGGKIDLCLVIDELDIANEPPWHTLSVKWFASAHVGIGDDLEDVPLVLFKPPCGFRSLAIRSLEASGLKWHCVYEAEDLMSLRSAVQAGVGVTLLPYVAQVVGLRSLEGVSDLPRLPEFAVMLRERAGWNPGCRQQMLDLIRTAWASEYVDGPL